MNRDFTFAIKDTTLSYSFFIFYADVSLSLSTFSFGMNFFTASFYLIANQSLTFFNSAFSCFFIWERSLLIFSGEKSFRGFLFLVLGFFIGTFLYELYFRFASLFAYEGRNFISFSLDRSKIGRGSNPKESRLVKKSSDSVGFVKVSRSFRSGKTLTFSYFYIAPFKIDTFSTALSAFLCDDLNPLISDSILSLAFNSATSNFLINSLCTVRHSLSICTC